MHAQPRLLTQQHIVPRFEATFSHHMGPLKAWVHMGPLKAWVHMWFAHPHGRLQAHATR